MSLFKRHVFLKRGARVTANSQTEEFLCLRFVPCLIKDVLCFVAFDLTVFAILFFFRVTPPLLCI